MRVLPGKVLGVFESIFDPWCQDMFYGAFSSSTARRGKCHDNKTILELMMHKYLRYEAEAEARSSWRSSQCGPQLLRGEP